MSINTENLLQVLKEDSNSEWREAIKNLKKYTKHLIQLAKLNETNCIIKYSNNNFTIIKIPSSYFEVYIETTATDEDVNFINQLKK